MRTESGFGTADPDPRRSIPRTDAVLADRRLRTAEARLGPAAVRLAVTTALGRARRGEIPPSRVADEAAAALPMRLTSLRPVVNATGVIVHTNLGRAPLSAAAVDALLAAAGTTDVEFDLESGRRGRRGAAVAAALQQAVPGSEAAHLVNNGAAAALLAVTALAAGREVVVSRGELVEIGDGFRLPELLESAGARLREVGTTNRTTSGDYARALSADTGALLKVHPSNFRMSGFTGAASVSELAAVARSAALPLIVDIGSGLLQPHPQLPDEPDARSVLAAGADLVTASGDKLLGGPQAGLLLGRADLVERCRRHPIARALRVDKLTLSAMEATLRGPATPVARFLDVRPPEIEQRAIRLAARLTEAGMPAEAVPTRVVVGGGGAPGLELASWAVAVRSELSAVLRRGDPAVVGRVEQGRLLLDLRAVPASDDDVLAAAVLAAHAAESDVGHACT